MLAAMDSRKIPEDPPVSFAWDINPPKLLSLGELTRLREGIDASENIRINSCMTY